MKIEYRTPAGSGSYATLADESGATGLGDQISGYQPVPRKTPQTEQLALSAAQFVRDAGNTIWQLKFKVARVHASPDAAVEFVATHVALFTAFGASVDLQITVGATVLHMLGAAMVTMPPEPASDLSTVFAYEFTGPTYG